VGIPGQKKDFSGCAVRNDKGGMKWLGHSRPSLFLFIVISAAGEIRWARNFVIPSR
jgi:hypothetical protein